jgi:hypothetical protein
MPAAALGVHQLRYWLAFGGNAGVELRAQGHSYLHSVVPWIVMLAAVAASIFVRAAGRALSGEPTPARRTLSFAALWLLCSVMLVAIYSVQEFLEGLYLIGHPSGLVGIFGYGGWWAIPAACAVGLVLAALFRGAGWVLAEIVRRRRVRAGHVTPSSQLAPAFLALTSPAPLADGWSGRGPPR